MINKIKRKHFTRFIASMLLIIPAAGITGVYKWVDENGQVHYGAHPGNVDAESVTIRSNETTKPRALKTADDEESADGKADEKTEEKAEQQPKKPEKPTISRKEKNRLCKQARSDVAAISSRGRMREINAKGEYIYLSEKGRQQRLSAANARIRKYCR